LIAIVLHSLWNMVSKMDVQTLAQLTLYIIYLAVLIAFGLFLVIWRFRKARGFDLKVANPPWYRMDITYTKVGVR
jgi:hypothetical protein